MEQVHPTRMELMKKRSQIVLAEQGRDLLKEKMEALIQEFFKIMVNFSESREGLEQLAVEADIALLVAEAVDDPVAVKSASYATKRQIMVDISGKNIMGVPVPVIQKTSVALNVMQRGYGLIGTSSRINEAAEKFESELDMIIRLAETETTLRRLGNEIQMNRRRVNALDQIIIPELKDQAKYIRFSIEEREREDLFRLKKVKKLIERKKVKKKMAQAGTRSA
ncbi:V-type ATP synthase subunit D [Methanospirillum purgamenti]|uniref:A-type ATP synthase subunit D n=1 Tax=Methanospirillum hungatei TaxID=2203 RepID=A0A8F5VNZ5_METHU|nr:V-type ATP synthase subunit D [Methanospirillum hungatei]QXO94383.1 V-type ATP synthase subunit D [Methanospirillum hungatei]